MCLVVDLGQMLPVKVSVDLGGADAGVAQQLLHGAQVATGLQHMAGKRVPQHVRMHRHRHTGALAAASQTLPYGLGGDAPPTRAHEECGLVACHARWRT